MTFTYTNGIRTEWIGSYVNIGTANWGKFIPGTDLVYFRAHDGNGYWESFVCNADGTDAYYHISSPAYAFDIAMSPTGNKLVWGHASGFNQPTTLMACNVDGSDRVTLKSFSVRVSPLALADGNTLVWTSGGSNIMAIDMDGTNERTVIDDENVYKAYNYDPVEKQGLLMGSNRSDGNMHLFKMNVDGTGITQLTDGLYMDEVPMLSPNGQFLSYLRLPFDYVKGSVPYPYELVVKKMPLIIDSPDSTSLWETGTTQDINWISTDMISNVKFEIYENGILLGEITSTTPNDGVYSWAIPSGLAASAQYRIKISDAANPSTSDYSDLFELFNPTFAIIAPDSTSVWETGTSHDIYWTSTGTISDVKIELYENNLFVSEIASSTPNDGAYSWAIPSSLAASVQYQIKISGVANPSASDYSDLFELFNPTLTITVPDVTSSWETGTTQSIQWTSTGTISDVKIDLYENDVFVAEIVASTPNDGEYSWAIPSSLTASVQYQIKISDVVNPSTSDYSDLFELFNPPTLTITVPDSTSSWETGTAQSIQWTSTGTISDIKIELYENGVLVMEIVPSTPNDGDYSWTIPSSLAASMKYQIKISDVANPLTSDNSDNFEIFNPALTITIPDTTTSWQTGTSQSIKWTSRGTISNVKIDLYKNGVFVNEISASTPNDGEFSWTLPLSLTPSADYQIKIIDVLNPSTSDYSDEFEITIPAPAIPGYDLYLLFSIVCVVSAVLIKKRLKSIM